MGERIPPVDLLLRRSATQALILGAAVWLVDRGFERISHPLGRWLGPG
jgi:hypothetical protein